MLCRLSFSRWGREHISLVFDKNGSQHIKRWRYRMNVNDMQLPVGYLNATIRKTPQSRNWKFDPMGLAQPGNTCGVMCTGLGLAHQAALGRVLGRFSNWTNLVLLSEPGLQAGYSCPLLTVLWKSVSISVGSIRGSGQYCGLSCFDIVIFPFWIHQQFPVVDISAVMSLDANKAFPNLEDVELQLWLVGCW